MREAALALSALLLAGVMTAMLIGWALVWATSCKEPQAPEPIAEPPAVVTTVAPTSTTLPPDLGP